MRTTLDFDDDLMREAKQRAAADGETLTRLIERAMRLYLSRVAEAPATYRFEPVIKRGRRPPLVDLSDRDATHGAMDRSD